MRDREQPLRANPVSLALGIPTAWLILYNHIQKVSRAFKEIDFVKRETRNLPKVFQPSCAHSIMHNVGAFSCSAFSSDASKITKRKAAARVSAGYASLG